SQLEYAGARFYDPSLGMFLTHDAAHQFANPYSYGGGDPVNGTDPTGNVFGIDDAVEAFVIGFAGGFAASAIQPGLDGATLGQSLKAGLVGGAIGGATSVGLGIIGGEVGPTVAPYLHVAEVAYGGYSTYNSFEHGQLANGAVGAAFLAMGLYQLANEL